MNPKYTKTTHLWLWLCLPLALFSCDPIYYDNMEVYNGTSLPITVVLGKDMTNSGSGEIQAFLQKAGCGQNIQHLGNNYYITGCPLQPGENFEVYSFYYLGHKDVYITDDTNAFHSYSLPFMFDTLYLEGDTLLKKPKIFQNWPYKEDRRLTTFTFSILPGDIQ